MNRPPTPKPVRPFDPGSTERRVGPKPGQNATPRARDWFTLWVAACLILLAFLAAVAAVLTA